MRLFMILVVIGQLLLASSAFAQPSLPTSTPTASVGGRFSFRSTCTPS